MVEIVLRCVPGYGWLPVIECNGKEMYRGEFSVTAHHALMKAEQWLEERDNEYS